MSGANNFLRWNSGGNNQENDAAYAADAQRINGATTPSLFPAQTGNKLFFQQSIMVFALAQMMANKNYNMSDADETNLIGALTNILTFFDLPAVFTSPAFTGNPTCPTPAVGDNDTSVVNSAFVKAVLGASGGFVFSQALPGYIKFPTALGGFILQWALGDTGGSPVVNQATAFPLAFPTGCLAVLNACRTGTQTSSINFSGNNWLLTGNGTYWMFAIGR